MSKSGQTSVEYSLLLLVVITLIISIMGHVRSYILANQGNCKPTSKSIACTLERLYSPDSYRFYTLFR